MKIAEIITRDIYQNYHATLGTHCQGPLYFDSDPNTCHLVSIHLPEKGEQCGGDPELRFQQFLGLPFFLYDDRYQFPRGEILAVPFGQSLEDPAGHLGPPTGQLVSRTGGQELR